MGRPKRHPEDKKSVHRILMPAHAGGSKPMQCRMLGCNQRLRYRQDAICCSEDCEAALKKLCETYLAIINGEMLPQELPYYYRVRGQDRHTPFVHLTKRQQEIAIRESKSAEAGRLRRDTDPGRWYPHMPSLPAQKGEAQRSTQQVGLPDFSDKEEGD